MNILDILDDVSKADAEIYDRIDSRRKAMSAFTGFGKRLTMAAIPTALASMFTKAYGQSNASGMADVLDVLQFALAAEYLEGSLYALGVSRADALGADSKLKTGIAKIAMDEFAHIELLKATITQLGGRPLRGGDASNPNKDYGVDVTGGGGTGNGPFAGAATSLEEFLKAAQVASDLGVRAYKGQAARLISNNAVLLAGLNIHSVEARHVSFIRNERRKRYGDDNIRPWISGSMPYLGGGSIAMGGQAAYESGADASKYPSEANTMQAGINISSLPGVPNARIASEAFDEPLSKQDVLNILGVPGSGMGSPNAKFFY